MTIKKFKSVGIMLLSLSILAVVGFVWVMSLNAADGPCYCVQQSASYGGGGGSEFKDGPFFGAAVKIKKIMIRSGSQVDSIQVQWVLPCGTLFDGIQHGGNGGNLSTIELASDEYITSISGRCGSEVDQLIFNTNKGNVFGPYGGTGGSPFNISNISLCGFFGRSGSGIDRIGVISK